MGQVFYGQSPGGRPVAVKLIRDAHARDPQFRARFAREVEAARRVGGFHTAQVVDADPHAEPPWMVTAFVAGPSLADAVAARGPMPLDQVRALGAALVEGLTAIHGCGLVHRDLKPGNVLLANDGPRIIDFGLARASDATPVTATGAVLGTYAYMSPEQVRGEPTGPMSDVFSLGCVLAYAACGRGPFDADSVPAIVHRITAVAPALDGLASDPALRDAIVGCLAKSPAERSTLPQLLAAFTARGATGGASPAPQPAAAVTTMAPAPTVTPGAGYDTPAPWQPPTLDAQPPPPARTSGWVLPLIGPWLAALAGAYLLTATSGPAGPHIVVDLGISDSTVRLLFLTFLIALLLASPLGVLLGRRFPTAVTVPATVVLILGSLVATLAPSVGILLVGRAVSGLGAGAAIGCAAALLTRVPDRRPTIVTSTVCGLAFIFAVIVGPFISATLAAATTWRWSFLLTLPVLAVALVATIAIRIAVGSTAANTPPMARRQPTT